MAASRRFQSQLKIDLMLLGDSGVGKTSVISRFYAGTFEEPCMSTTGVDFRQKVLKLKEQEVKIQIWDTAGQERFHAIMSAYYRNAHGIILVYDVGNRESFDNVVRWLGDIKEYARDDVRIMLLGNKVDNSERAISTEEGETFARSNQIMFYETSAKIDINVNNAINELAEAILIKMPNNSPSSQPHQLIYDNRHHRCCQ